MTPAIYSTILTQRYQPNHREATSRRLFDCLLSGSELAVACDLFRCLCPPPKTLGPLIFRQVTVISYVLACEEEVENHRWEDAYESKSDEPTSPRLN